MNNDQEQKEKKENTMNDEKKATSTISMEKGVDMKKEKESAAKTVSAAIGLIVLVVVIFIGGSAAAMYYGNWRNSYSQAVSSVVPFPVAKVNGSLVSLRSYNENVRALTQYFETEQQLDLSDAENGDLRVQLEQSVLVRMIEDAVVRDVSREVDVTVSDSEVDDEFDAVTSELGEESDVDQTLSDLYGWNIAEFKKNVLKNQLQKERLQEYYQENDEITAGEQARAKEVLDKLNAGEDFAVLAEEYSEDPQSAAQGGDLGLTQNGVFVPEFEEAALALESGQVSDLVRTQFGYHIIKLESKSDTEFQARHILIATSFEEWLLEKIKEASVSIYINTFSWDAENAIVEINDLDADGIVDDKDTDDDNDGASDEEEDAAASDPKDKNSTPDNPSGTNTINQPADDLSGEESSEDAAPAEGETAQ